MVISDLIIELHKLARETTETDLSMKIRLIADELAKVGNELHTRENILVGALQHDDGIGYEESTHEKQAEFAKKRNYTYYEPL